MSDVALRWDNDRGLFDLAIVDDDIAADDGLNTAVLLSLFTDARADDGNGVERGHWADQFGPDSSGSQLWRLQRQKRQLGLASATKTWAERALQWMIDDNIATSVAVTVSLDEDVLCLAIEIERPPNEVLNIQFSQLWESYR